MMSTKQKILAARSAAGLVRMVRGVLGAGNNTEVRRDGLHWRLDLDEGIGRGEQERDKAVALGPEDVRPSLRWALKSTFSSSPRPSDGLSYRGNWQKKHEQGIRQEYCDE